MKKPSEMTTPELLNWSGQVMHGEIEVGQEDRNALDKEGEARGITASAVIAHYFANLPADHSDHSSEREPDIDNADVGMVTE